MKLDGSRWMGWCVMAVLVVLGAAQQCGATDVALTDGWQMHTGCGFPAKGEALSSGAAIPTAGWMRATVPTTVVAAQVANGVLPDPFFGQNLRRIPGESYPIGANFSDLPMPANSPYACGWWYRTRFTAPAPRHGKTTWLHLGQVNYRAEIWLNGKQVATSHDVAGAYRTYNLNVTGAVRSGAENTLAIQVFAPTPDDLGVNWVDWNPAPPDKDMGIPGPVTVQTTGAVAVRSPMVTTHFTDATLREATLAVFGEIENGSSTAQTVTVAAQLLGMTLRQEVSIAAGEQKSVTFSSDKFPQLRLALRTRDPRIWWPYVMGAPHLEHLALSASVAGALSDTANATFGIREVTSSLTAQNHRLFRVNGKRILIRGGGWSQDMLLREDPARLRQQFALTQHLHLNAIRLEGKLETDDFFNLADERGILILAGWCCCDRWEHWKDWTADNHRVADASLRSQMLRLRAHPSLLVWLNGSDNNPPPDVEKEYLAVEQETHWPNPILSSASAAPTRVTGASGVKMSGPYDFVAPSYWLQDTATHGGAYGFNTETSPGPAIPNVSSLKRFLPADQMWPVGPDWEFHNGSGHFKQLTTFDTAMQHTYGTPQSLAQYETYAQAMAYDGERAMYEAYGKRKYNDATGVVQWMLNNAWPSTIWHLFDYYLDAGGGYYGARKANEPLHVQYAYDDHSVVVVNSMYTAAPGLRVTAKVYDPQLKELFSKSAQLDAQEDASQQVLALPANLFPEEKGLIRFVELTLADAKGNVLSRNFYWVPGQLTSFDWAKTDFAVTPASRYEDMTVLARLPQVSVQARLTRTAGSLRVALENPANASTLAFQIALRAVDAKGDAVDPAFWSDNYITLLPGESRVLTVSNAEKIAAVNLGGWNVTAQHLAASAR